MITKQKQPLVLLLFFISITNAQVNYRECRQTCGSSKRFPYPFGFSSGCAIRLNCSDDGASVGEFPVESITSDSIIVKIEAQCNRSFDTFRELFSHKYAPTSRNVILLENCTEKFLPCSIPETLVRTHFDSVGCGTTGTSDLNCFFENRTNGFINHSELNQIGCKYFMSSLSSPNFRNFSDAPVSLDVNTVELGWWIQGDRCLCSDNAKCSTIESPIDGKPGFRCRCRHSFVGDGFLAGTGCRKGQSCFYFIFFVASLIFSNYRRNNIF